MLGLGKVPKSASTSATTRDGAAEDPMAALVWRANPRKLGKVWGKSFDSSSFAVFKWPGPGSDSCAAGTTSQPPMFPAAMRRTVFSFVKLSDGTYYWSGNIRALPLAWMQCQPASQQPRAYQNEFSEWLTCLVDTVLRASSLWMSVVLSSEIVLFPPILAPSREEALRLCNRGMRSGPGSKTCRGFGRSISYFTLVCCRGE